MSETTLVIRDPESQRMAVLRDDVRPAVVIAGFAGSAGAAGPAGSGVAVTFASIAVATVIAGSVLAVNASGVFNPDLSVPADVLAIVGIAATSANSGNPVTGILSGPLTEVGWAWTPGAPIYCAATGGGLTQAPGLGSGAVQQVAVAMTPTMIQVGIEPAIFL